VGTRQTDGQTEGRAVTRNKPAVVGYWLVHLIMHILFITSKLSSAKTTRDDINRWIPVVLEVLEDQVDLEASHQMTTSWYLENQRHLSSHARPSDPTQAVIRDFYNRQGVG